MGDQVTIPRTFAGAIGVADVTSAVKRKYLTFGMPSTTGRLLGDATTGGFLFQRGQVFEKMTVNYHAGSTTTNIKFQLRAMKNGSAAASATYGSAVVQCTTTGWKSKEITPTIAAFTAADRFWLDFTAHPATTLKVSVILEFREAVG